MPDALFRSVAERVGLPVLGVADLDSLSALRAMIPASFNAFYVECRLGADGGSVDFLAGTTAKTSLRKELDDAKGVRFPDSSSWDALHRVVEGWCEASDLAAIPCVWIEFDDVTEAPRGDVLSFAVCLERGYPHRLEHGPDNLGLAERSIARLACEDVTEQLPALSRFFAALPEGGRVIHLSPMIGRRGAPLKIYGRVPVGTLSGFLRDAGWGGSDAQVAYLEDEFWKPCSTSPDVYFDVAVQPGGTPTIAIVFSPLELHACHPQDRRRIGLLRRLTELGLCSGDKAAALEAWVGDERLVDPSVPWPCRTERWLDIKVVRGPESAFAKAYLGFRAYRTLF